MLFAIDENTNQFVKNADLSLGSVTEHVFEIQLQWIETAPAEKEMVVLAEYPNGGKDVKFVEIKPAEGHWKITCDGEDVPDSWPIDTVIDFDKLPTGANDTSTVSVQGYYYHWFTADEIIEYQKKKEEFEKKQEENRIHNEKMRQLPDQVDTIEETQNDVILLLADIVGGVM